MDVDDLREVARYRYLTDPVFHARVDLAAQVMCTDMKVVLNLEPGTENFSAVQIVRGVSREAAMIALTLADPEIEAEMVRAVPTREAVLGDIRLKGEMGDD